MRFSSISSMLVLTASATAVMPRKRPASSYSPVPYTDIAGIQVIDTPLVRKARDLMEANFEPFLIRHVYRTWLYGAATLHNNDTLAAQIDLEAHAVACLLHDVGWDTRDDSPFTSNDKRFEVDAATYTAAFLRENGAEHEWDAPRIQSVWHGIALHGTASIGIHSPDPNVAFIVTSINMDYPGPHPRFSSSDYDRINAVFPRDGLGAGTNRAFTHIAATKPDVTYDTFLEPWGVAFVPGYNPVGHRVFDRGNPNVTSPVPSVRRNVHGL
ncbi:hypothetical protein GGR50DRAFT_53995 [Xylaria sp. CBS 124048]|nr:hypothetical protein GGR50DRAFT_53995 [Xylaria sp. CBS 124048]